MDKASIQQKADKFGRFFLRRVLVWVLQGLFFVIAIALIKNNVFLSFDLSIWQKLNDFRAQNSPQLRENLLQNLNNVTLVGIDEKFFTDENISTQGLHRGYYAKVIENINKENPATVGIDIFFQNRYNFSENGSKEKMLNKIFQGFDKQLTDSLQSNNVMSIIESNGVALDIDSGFLTNDPRIGHVHSHGPYKGNGTNLGITNYIETESGRKIFPLSIEAYLQYSKANSIDKSTLPILGVDENSILIKDPSQTLLVPLSNNKYIYTPLYITSNSENYSKLYNNNINYVSFYDVYHGNYDPSIFKDKAVFIGATDIALNDIKTTLSGQIPGVYMHINQFLALINNDFIYVLNELQTIVLVFVLLLFNGYVIFLFRNSSSSMLVFVLLLFELAFIIIGGGSLVLFNNIFGFQLPYYILVPMGTILLIFFLQVFLNLMFIFFETYFLKDNFQKLFSLYVGEKLSSRTKKDISDVTKKSAEEKQIAMFFSDIAGFTSLSERMSPTENITFLNEYLDKMSEIIAQHRGFIDKYIGDAIMAFWENKEGSIDAAKSAIGNIQNLGPVNQEIKRLLNLPSDSEDLIDIRIGLNFGKAIVGDIGSEKYKLNHTIIGDQVNLCARLEGINKFYSTKICFSEFMYEDIKDEQELLIRKLDRIKVKGKDKPVEIFELIPLYKSQLSQGEIDQKLAFIQQFETGLNHYFLGEFNKAIELFTQCYDLFNDKTSKMFIERCEHLIEDNPENWDGVWTFKVKG